MTGWRACLVVLLALLGTGQSCANTLVDGGSAKVISVVDGDTVLLDSRIDGSNEVRLLVIKKKDQIFRLWFETDPKDMETMALGFRRTTFSCKRLTQDEIAAIGPLKIRFETVLEGAVLKHWPGVCR